MKYEPITTEIEAWDRVLETLENLRQALLGQDSEAIRAAARDLGGALRDHRPLYERKMGRDF